MRNQVVGDLMWSLKQTAIAAAKYPGYPPTKSGLTALQTRWLEAGHGRPWGSDFDMAWARAAFNDIDAHEPFKPEQVIA